MLFRDVAVGPVEDERMVLSAELLTDPPGVALGKAGRAASGHGQVHHARVG